MPRSHPQHALIRAVSAASLPLNFALADTVGDMRIFCRFGLRETAADTWEPDSDGCPHQPRVADASTHDAVCGFAIVRCPFAGCGEEMRRSDAAVHDANEAVKHARGERAARVALEARLEARLAALEGSGSQAGGALDALRVRMEAAEGKLIDGNAATTRIKAASSALATELATARDTQGQLTTAVDALTVQLAGMAAPSALVISEMRATAVQLGERITAVEDDLVLIKELAQRGGRSADYEFDGW